MLQISHMPMLSPMPLSVCSSFPRQLETSRHTQQVSNVLLPFARVLHLIRNKMHWQKLSSRPKDCRVGFTSSSLNNTIDCSCARPHVHVRSEHNSSLAILGENFPSWLTSPMNLLTSDTDLGASIFKHVEVFSGST